MKKQLFWMIGAALALTSCSNDEQVAVNPGNEITFRTTVPMRATASDIYNDKSGKELNEFNVNAWIVENDDDAGVHHIQNETYAKSGDNYEIKDKEPHYWGVEDKSIWGEAYASGYLDIKVSTEAKDVYKYTVIIPASVEQQQDFITAPIYKLKENATSGIGLTFKHQLAKIGISAKNESEYDIKIKDVVLGHVKNGTIFEVKVTELGVEDSESTQWTTMSEDVNYTYTATTAITLNKLAGDAKNAPVTSLLNAQEADQQFFMLVPQDITTTWETGTIDEDENGAYIALLANITHNVSEGDPLIVFPTGSDIENDKTEDGTVYGWVCVAVPATTWEANKQYNYLLTFKNDAVGSKKDKTAILTAPISFTAKVSNWDEEVDVNALNTPTE